MAKRYKFDATPPFTENNSIISETVLEIFKNLERSYSESKTVPDESLLALNAIFGDTLGKALDLVEKDCVSYFYTNQKAVGVYQVEGSSHSIYTIFPSINYCPCPAFKYKVARGSNVTCKHVLASLIANVIEKVKYIKLKMNEREDWHNRNPFMNQFVYPPPEIPPAFGPATNWVHVPPQTMPWGLPASLSPQVMRFTAGDFNPIHNHHPVKRKPDPDVELPPTKQLVTEEKMAAHMSALHISESDSQNSKPQTQTTTAPCDDDSMEQERLPRLIVSEEIKNLKTDPVIPQSILSTIERPKMALVLWQPPAGDIGAKLREVKKKREEEEEKEKDIDVSMETENNNVTNTFRPIDPVPMLPAEQNHYLQPTPQFHQYYPLS